MAPDPSLAVSERDLQPALPTISINNREIETGVSPCLAIATSPIRPRSHAQVFISKISGDQIIRTPASANVDLGSGGTY
jgi:hypothetical protein